MLSISIPRSSPSASASPGMQTSLWRLRLRVCNLSSLVYSPLTLRATKATSATIRALGAQTVLDGPEQPCLGTPHTSLPRAAPLQLPRPVSCCLAGHLCPVPFPKSWLKHQALWRDQKKMISHLSMVCLTLKILLQSWLSGLQFSFLSVHLLTNTLPLFQLCH